MKTWKSKQANPQFFQNAFFAFSKYFMTSGYNPVEQTLESFFFN